MALADILERIESDAEVEAAEITAAARERADAILAAARAKAEAHVADVVAAAERDAARDAETTVVNARLRGRDDMVTARRSLIDEALSAAAEGIAALGDADYARFLAARIAEVARGGESLSFGELDTARADAVMSELSRLAPSLSLARSGESAPFPRGALLEGSRVRVDLSLPAIVNERRDDLESQAVIALFGERE